MAAAEREGVYLVEEDQFLDAREELPEDEELRTLPVVVVRHGPEPIRVLLQNHGHLSREASCAVRGEHYLSFAQDAIKSMRKVYLKNSELWRDDPEISRIRS